MSDLENAVEALLQGKIISYPTEGVFGIGCDPDNEEAVKRLIKIKKRRIEKGLILVAADYGQLLPYIDEPQLTETQKIRLQESWPGPVTWVIPASTQASHLLTGVFDTIAVRVTNHPIAKQLCILFGKPVTSTSANLSGQPPCTRLDQVKRQLGDHLALVLPGHTGDQKTPTEIRDIKNLEILRKG